MSETRDVYIGVGKTIRVIDDDKVRYYLDIDKLSALVKEHKEVVVGAIGDWFFTAIPVNEKDLEEIKMYKKRLLRSSGWSRFAAMWGDNNEEDVTLEIPLNFQEYSYAEGCSALIFRIEDRFPGLWHNCIKKLDYENIKKLQAEINPIIEKYAAMAEEKNSAGEHKGGETKPEGGKLK